MAQSPWIDILGDISRELDSEECRLWLQPLQLMPTSSSSHLRLGCPNNFHRAWVRDHYLDRLNELAGSYTPGAALELVLLPGPKKDAPPRQMELPRLGPWAPSLNWRFVFDRFVSGSGNEFACAAAKALASGGGLLSNSLFLMSGTGLGKSHLTQAVGHQVLGGRPDARVAYLTAEDFTNQMIAAIRKKTIHQFKERFRRQCDVLLLEEVQFLAGKEKTQEELVYTLDALDDAGKRVVFTGRMAPAQLKGLKPALASRLAASVTVNIEPPDQDTRVRILIALAQEDNVQVPREVLEFMAQEVTDDIRRLRSVLVGLLARASLTGQAMDHKMAAEVLGHISARLKRLDPEQILLSVARAFGIKPDVLSGKSRKKTVTRPRNLAMYLCRRHTEASYASIGKAFNRDHATVMYSVDQVERRLKQEPKLKGELSYLEQRLGVAAAA